MLRCHHSLLKEREIYEKVFDICLVMCHSDSLS